jgi:uncharacterized protein HemY
MAAPTSTSERVGCNAWLARDRMRALCKATDVTLARTRACLDAQDLDGAWEAISATRAVQAVLEREIRLARAEWGLPFDG